MTSFLKSLSPYILMIALLVLTLCTKDQPSAEERRQIEKVDSLATELEVSSEEVISETDESEQAIDDLLEDI